MTIQQIRITGTGSELQGVGRADDVFMRSLLRILRYYT